MFCKMHKIISEHLNYETKDRLIEAINHFINGYDDCEDYELDDNVEYELNDILHDLTKQSAKMISLPIFEQKKRC